MVAMLAFDFFCGISCWSHLQSRSLETFVAPVACMSQLCWSLGERKLKQILWAGEAAWSLSSPFPGEGNTF